MSSLARRSRPPRSDRASQRPSALPLPRSTLRPPAMPRAPRLPSDLQPPAPDLDDVDVDETPSLHTLARTWTDSLIDHREIAPRSVEEELLETAGVCEQLEAIASVAPPPIETQSPPPHVVRYRELVAEREGYGVSALMGAFALGVVLTLAAVVAVPDAASLTGAVPPQQARSGWAALGADAVVEREEAAAEPAPAAAPPTAAPESQLAAPAPTLAPEAVPAAPSASSVVAPQRFEPAVARAAVAAAAARAAACNDGNMKGSARVAVTFASSGRATRALLDYGSPLAGTNVGSCIARTMSGAQMPPFEGGPVTVTKTVTLR